MNLTAFTRITAFLAVFWLPLCVAQASDQNVNPKKPALLPIPQSITWSEKAVPLKSVKLSIPKLKGDKLRIAHLKAEINDILKRNQVTITDEAEQQIRLRIGKVDVPNQWKGQGKEAYEIVVEKRGVVITANAVEGLNYGVQTLRQLMVHKDGKTTVAACKIKDHPAFKIRGFMHDVGRNFQTLELLKMQIENAAKYKLNTFHFHVTEYHGWRLESKKYPELQRLDTFTRKPGKYYTQQEFKDLVDFCWARGITLIPEFDTPGHSDAFRKAFGLKNMKDPRAKELLVELFDELCSLVPKEKMPYIHVGTDEASKKVEQVDADYLPTIHKAIQRNGRDVIGWVHGMHIKGDTKQIQQTWASSKPYKEMRHIDSRANYLNYLQALNFATRMTFQQPCRVPHGDDMNLGGILCYWPDTKVDDENQGMVNSPVMSAAVAYSESVWKGVEKDKREYWCVIPPRGTAEFKAYVDFEERILEQRDRFMAGKPFHALRTHDKDWRFLGPWPNGTFEELEKGIIKDSYNAGGKTYSWADPIQGSVLQFRHFFKFPSHIKKFRKGADIIWANTFIYSDKDQEVDAWIDFNTIASSGYKGRERLRKQGTWSNNENCNVWINGEAIAPPEWQSKKAGMEHALTNEIYSARPPHKIKLKKGWNSVLAKCAPHYKWSFSFSPIKVDKDGNISDVEGLIFSPTKSFKKDNTPKHAATKPAHRIGTGWWKQRHAQKIEAAKTAKCDILFIGDSITHMWESRSGKLWQEKYVKRNAFNIGYSGDQTQHVLWRLDNGELTNFKPKVAVLMIGTNNTGHQRDWTAQKVTDGIQAIIDRVHANCPETKVLLLGIFPRGATPQDRFRVKNDEINKLISKFHNGNSVHYLDISSKLLEKDGTLSKKVMPDLLHPNAHGYKLWHDAMEPLLKKLLKESKAPGVSYNSAIVPAPKLENDFYDWRQRHEDVKQLVKKKDAVELIFIGDSITHMFGGAPKSRIARGVPTWEKFYGSRNVINMGFGWDRTQNMLWRLRNGALDGISPKVAVVLAGTNNLTGTKNAPTNTPKEIAAGVKAICDTIYQKSPTTKIVVISVLPRKGFEHQVKEINNQLPVLAKQKHISYVNLWEKFVTADGAFNPQLFRDTVHPNAAGYQVFAEALEPSLERLLGD